MCLNNAQFPQSGHRGGLLAQAPGQGGVRMQGAGGLGMADPAGPFAFAVRVRGAGSDVGGPRAGIAGRIAGRRRRLFKKPS